MNCHYKNCWTPTGVLESGRNRWRSEKYGTRCAAHLLDIQLNWVLAAKGKNLIFCSSIWYGFKLAVYFWHLDPKSVVSNQNIQLFKSLNSPEYNHETLWMLVDNKNSKITIATDKLLVGMDVSDFQTVIILDPKDLDDLWQKAGHVGHDCTKVHDTRVIVYSGVQKE